MVVSTPSRKLTYEDFVRFPEDGRRHEILDGEHVVTPAPSPLHQRVVLALARRIGNYLAEHELGELYLAPTGVLLSKNDVVEPDLSYISRARLSLVGDLNLQGPPDFVVEVLSPSSRRRDQGSKRERYEALGIGEYWIVDPVEETATVFRRTEAEARCFEPPVLLSAKANDVLTSYWFPGLEMSLPEIFRR